MSFIVNDESVPFLWRVLLIESGLSTISEDEPRQCGERWRRQKSLPCVSCAHLSVEARGQQRAACFVARLVTAGPSGSCRTRRRPGCGWSRDYGSAGSEGSAERRSRADRVSPSLLLVANTLVFFCLLTSLSFSPHAVYNTLLCMCFLLFRDLVVHHIA